MGKQTEIRNLRKTTKMNTSVSKREVVIIRNSMCGKHQHSCQQVGVALLGDRSAKDQRQAHWEEQQRKTYTLLVPVGENGVCAVCGKRNLPAIGRLRGENNLGRFLLTKGRFAYRRILFSSRGGNRISEVLDWLERKGKRIGVRVDLASTGEGHIMVLYRRGREYRAADQFGEAKTFRVGSTKLMFAELDKANWCAFRYARAPRPGCACAFAGYGEF